MRHPKFPTTAGGQSIAIQVAYGHYRRQIALPPSLAYILFGLAPILVACCLGIGGYLVFRDDMLASLMRRQAQMQFSYEDRIAALRSQIDTLASRQMLNQDSFEGKVAELSVRQSRLESRSALIAALAAKVAPGETTIAVRRGAPAAPAMAAAPVMPAPTRPIEAKDNLKPAPEGFDLRRTRPVDGAGDDVSENADPAAPAQRLRNLAQNFDRMEQRQVAALDNLNAPAAAKAERMRAAFAEAGLPVDRLTRHAESLARPKAANSAMGGPFEPAPLGDHGGAFERAYEKINHTVALMDGMRSALPFAPLRQPLPGPLDVTSGFGYRTDPFLGRPALHSGMDFRGSVGDPIHATAEGRVTIAGPMGGYGNMVEIDHGAGLATRYGHMSHIDVAEGQWVRAGQVIGEIGSTGRSTGPHLHYEVRVDGAAVDPSRYLRAGRILNSSL